MLKPGSWRSLVARTLLLVGAGGVAHLLIREIPRTNTLKLDVGSAGPSVKRVDLEWTPAGDDAPGGGVTLRFPEKAPKLVVFPLDLRTGDYWFQVVLHRDCEASLGRCSTMYRRHLRLGGGDTTVSLGRRP